MRTGAEYLCPIEDGSMIQPSMKIRVIGRDGVLVIAKRRFNVLFAPVSNSIRTLRK